MSLTIALKNCGAGTIASIHRSPGVSHLHARHAFACHATRTGDECNAKIRYRTGYRWSRKTAEAGAASDLAEIVQRSARHGPADSVGAELRDRRQDLLRLCGAR